MERRVTELVAGFPSQPRRRGARALLGSWGTFLLAVAASGALFAAPAGARSYPNSAEIAFYGDIGNAVNSPYRKNPLLVRPSTLLLAEDGSVALVDLRWSGWGTSAAHATGIWSASNGIPSQATGKRTTSPARLTLSNPGRVLGHRVYRCIKWTPSHPKRDVWAAHECIRRIRGMLYGYTPVSMSTPPPPATSWFYSLPGWYCAISTHAVSCEYEGPKGETVELSASGKVGICHAKPTDPCGIGNPGLGSPSIRPGQQVTVAPFRCGYATTGLTCVVIKTGHGFQVHDTTVIRIGP